jgi:hypothetical protein
MTDRNTLIETLATLTERDETGRHFTETCNCLDELEDAGWIEIDRPTHEQTGIPFSEEYWRLTVTDEGIAEVEAAGYLE